MGKARSTHGDMINGYEILIAELEVKKPLRSPGHLWRKNIKMSLKSKSEWGNGLDSSKESIIFWNMTPRSPSSFNRRFGGTYRLHLQGRRNKFSKNQQASRWQAFLSRRIPRWVASLPPCLLVFAELITSTLKIFLCLSCELFLIIVVIRNVEQMAWGTNS
jgi:hypothetical protein